MSLINNLPHVGLATHVGILLAFAARFRRFGSLERPPQYVTVRLLWLQALQHFRTPHELPASVLAHLQLLVEDFFKDRAKTIHSMPGFEFSELASGALRQAKEVPIVFRIVMDSIINRTLLTAPQEVHLLPVAANSDYYFLLSPFFEEHFGFAASVALSSAVTSLNATLGGQSASSSILPPPLPGTASQPAADGSSRGTFVGLPASPDLVGPALAVMPSPSLACTRCRGIHYTWECPVRYALLKREPCPGFDEQGSRIPTSWTNGELTPAAKSAWKSYITRHNLQQARLCPRVVDFAWPKFNHHQ